MFFSNFDKMTGVSKYKKKGQVAPFLIAVIAVLITALMITVNIGRVGLTRTTTSNAADAGALAAGTIHTETLNALADVDLQLMMDYVSAVVVFLIPKPIWVEPAQYVSWYLFALAQLMQFVFAWMSGIDGYEEAPKTARQLAFSNAGVDEPKPRNTGESYDAWIKRDSPFTQWMDSKGYESGSQYNWQDKGVYPDYTPRANSVTVAVDAPSFPGLYPLPGVPLITPFYLWIPFCNPCCCPVVPCCECIECLAALAIFDEGVAAAIARPITLSYGWYSVPWGLFTDAPIIIPPICPCGGMTAWATVIYPPAIFTFGILEDDPQTTVTVTRMRPDSNLGLWTMQQGTITSSARGECSGGSVGPFVPDPDYDSKLISAN